MQILFLGNSFTYVNDLPSMVGKMLSCETAAVTRGGAKLHDFLSPEDSLSVCMEEALGNGPWDYAVIQEQSFTPIGNREDFLASVQTLCARIREIGAVPVVYSTWAYEEGSEKLNNTGYSYAAMAAGLTEGYRMAAEQNGALLCPVGAAFDRARKHFPLYHPQDHYHPSVYGTYLAACVFARLLAPEKEISSWLPEGLTQAEARKLQIIAKE